MTRTALLIGLLLGASASIHAHRLDEYLQAAQVAVSTDRIAITLNLTPGVAIADDIVPRLDQDGDGRILPEEAESYGREVVADLLVSVDSHTLSLTLRRIEVPTIPEFREGVGTIRIDADAVSPSLADGAHQLRLDNRHPMPGSVYLSTALLPETDTIRIRRQQRDPEQRTLLIDYDMTANGQFNISWLFVAAVLLLAHGHFRLAGIKPGPTNSRGF